MANSAVSSSRVELQLNFIAKQLELERVRRSKLQTEVEGMKEILRGIEDDGKAEAE